MTREEMLERARLDFQKVAGHLVMAREGHVCRDDNIDLLKFYKPVEILLHEEIDEEDLQLNRDSDLYVLDTYYPADFAQSCPALDALDIHLCWLDGPTYYSDGRVEYPYWWPEEKS